jgi:acyl-CoA synthetase (AMP-forming)/AMP-acid ligase II/acyl carrier protein
VSASVSQRAAAASIVDVLRARALETPGRTAYTFLRDGETPEPPLSYAALDERARAIAAWLQAEAKPGDRALLLYPPGLDFVCAFFGCLYAGVIAVPAYPPRANRPDPRIEQIAADSSPSVVLTTEGVRAVMQSRPPLPGLAARWRATDAADHDGAEGWRETPPPADAVALLQYTSGSTFLPKGVMVTHGNLRHNSEEIDRIVRQQDDSVSVSWLPHFHDMGLVYGVLQPLYRGFEAVLMAPAAFLQRPVRWLQAVSRFRATLSGAPNFAYDLCTNRITAAERATLDLSRWQVAFNGAEPLRASTFEGFARAFASCGLRRSTLTAAYGMAEATLMVTIGSNGEEPRFLRVDGGRLEKNQVAPAEEADPDARTLVGSGPVRDVPRVVITDPQTLRPSSAGTIGEIWVAGPSVAAGYWNRPEETARTFGARHADTGDGPFLRTGDLGFIREGELFVTGRLKDLIIIRGLNHYPQDIEQTVAQSHPALRPDAGAAFSVEAEGEERLVVVHEVERAQRRSGLEDVVAAIRRAVTEGHEVEPYAVVLIRPATILKTSSGKIQRRACRTAFLEGTLAVLHEWRKPAGDAAPVAEVAPPSNGHRGEADISTWLAARIARECGLPADELDLAQPFAAFGLDSARALLLVGDLEAWLGRRLSPVVLWNYPTIEALARHLGR